MSRAQFPEASTPPHKDISHAKPYTSSADDDNAHILLQKVRTIDAVKLSDRSPDSQWDISIENDTITAIVPHDSQSTLPPTSTSPHVLDGRNCLLAPSLCHPHIHLDKCFLFFDPKYADLSIEKGDFAEALALTSQAKTRFSADDLERRGRWLIEESIAAGVTCMRAFVEVDATVGFKCLDAGLVLRERYRDACDVQICAFAQDPIFSGESAAETRMLMEKALQRNGVDVVGSTPYVEADEDLMRRNIDWAIDTAIKYDKHLDLHLDYNLDTSKEPMVYYLIDVLHKRQWVRKARDKQIVLGHCTRLTLFDKSQWVDLCAKIHNLPISFVGLPTSDLFMMGKPTQTEGGGERVRGTLQIPQMVQQYNLKGAIGVNNIGNSFTPQGSCDPLSIASMGVGIYQAGTKRDAEVLYECISTRAKEAIGRGTGAAGEIREGQTADVVVFELGRCGGGRERRTLPEIVYNPPRLRRILHKGRIVSVEPQ
ncbi:MAG: hypothetical protein Q9170_007700 [Blastenia crenularia]